MNRLLGLAAGLALTVVFLFSLWSFVADLFFAAQSPEELARSAEASLAPTSATLIEQRVSPRFWSPLSYSPGQVDVTYTGIRSFSEVVVFYESALASRGWTTDRLASARLGLYGVSACRGEERISVIDLTSVGREAFNVSLIPRLAGEDCPNGRPWYSAIAFIVVGSFTAYLAAATLVRTRSRRLRGTSVQSARGIAHWIVFFLFVPYAIVAFRIGPEVELATPVVWTGLVLTMAGIGVSLASLRSIAVHFDLDLEVHSGHELVRRGPYRFVRHPIYSGLVLHSLAACLATGNVMLAGGTFAVTIPGLLLRARTEEGLLRAALGDVYDRYARDVPMLLPRAHVRRRS